MYIWIYKTIFVSNLLYRDRKPKYISKLEKKHGGDGKRRPLTPSLFPAPWPCRPSAIETPPRPVLLGPSFHYPMTPHFLEYHPERAAPLFRRDDERRHAVDARCVLALRVYFAACNPSSSCRFWVLFWTISAPICLNRVPSWFRSTLAESIETWSLKMCVCLPFPPLPLLFL